MLPLLRWQEHHHPYEAIGRRAQAGARGDREADTSRRRWGSLRAAVLCGAALCSVGLWVAIRSDDGMDGAVSPSSLSRPTELSAVPGETGARIAGRKVGEELGSADALMQVLVTNKYQRDQASLDMPLYPWEHMAEPMRETRMEISSWPERGDRAELDFIWRLEGEVVGTGEAMSTYFESPGTYKCSVSAYLKGDGGKEELPGGSSGGGGGIDRLDNGRGEEVAAGPWLDRTSGVRLGSARGVGASGHVGASAGIDTGPGTNRLDFEVTVKYVRREIRSLTDRDRETFFNAMAVMQRVPSAVGRQVYGNKYYSKDYFNRIHLYYGGRKECDHFHAGAGFVTSHVAISLMFEQSLQAIEPSIALPYWDFTVEGTYYDWSNFRTSSIFSDDWFGDAAPKNEMRTPARGRFGFVPVMMNATEYSSVYNSYGMLRSPWNNDPTPYLTRSDHLMGFTNHRKPSGCRRYRETMMQTTWMSLTESFNDAAHGEIHELLGGAWSLEAAAYASKTNPVVQPFVHQAVPLLKMLWRMGYIGCPDTCAMDMPWEECRCSCSAETLNGEPPAEILEVSGVLAAGFFYDKDAVLIEDLVDDEGNAYEALPGYTRQETWDIYNEMLEALCTPLRFGTHYGATSTNDPTFMLIHPTFDRLWHLKRLEAKEGFDETWISDHPCYGHNPEDIMPFHNLFLEDTIGEQEHEEEDHTNGEVQIAKTYYTNQQLYKMLRPDEMDTPYVYDNFEWSHCDEQGIFIRGT